MPQLLRRGVRNKEICTRFRNPLRFSGFSKISTFQEETQVNSWSDESLSSSFSDGCLVIVLRGQTAFSPAQRLSIRDYKRLLRKSVWYASNERYPQLRHKIKMASIVWGLCTEWYWDRWRLAMITFIYCSKGEGEVYILTYKTNARSFASLQSLNVILYYIIILISKARQGHKS